MRDVARIGVSEFRRADMSELTMPLIITRDGEDLFAVVSLAMLERAIFPLLTVSLPVEVPVDFARDT